MSFLSKTYHVCPCGKSAFELIIRKHTYETEQDKKFCTCSFSEFEECLNQTIIDMESKLHNCRDNKVDCTTFGDDPNVKRYNCGICGHKWKENRNDVIIKYEYDGITMTSIKLEEKEESDLWRKPSIPQAGNND